MRPATRPPLVLLAAAVAAVAAGGATATAEPPHPGAAAQPRTGCPKDRDCDGVPDLVDAYPDDPTRSFSAAPPTDTTAPTVRITLPRKRTVAGAKAITFRLADPESKLKIAAVVADRRVRVGKRTREQSLTERGWRTSSVPATVDLSTQARDKASATVTLRLRNLLPGRYTVRMDAANHAGLVATKTARFQIR